MQPDGRGPWLASRGCGHGLRRGLIPAAAADTERTMPVTLRSNSLAMLSIAARRRRARPCVSASIFARPRIRSALSLKMTVRPSPDLVTARDAGNVAFQIHRPVPHPGAS